jgi:hypothetical protein
MGAVRGVAWVTSSCDRVWAGGAVGGSRRASRHGRTAAATIREFRVRAWSARLGRGGPPDGGEWARVTDRDPHECVLQTQRGSAVNARRPRGTHGRSHASERSCGRSSRGEHLTAPSSIEPMMAGRQAAAQARPFRVRSRQWCAIGITNDEDWICLGNPRRHYRW